MRAKISLSLPDDYLTWENFPSIFKKTDEPSVLIALEKSWDAVWNQSMQLLEEKGAINYCYFSLLRTHMSKGNFSLRIDLYNENWYLDQVECSHVCELTPLFTSFYKEYQEKRTKLSHYDLKVEYDLLYKHTYKDCLLVTRNFLRQNKNILENSVPFLKATRNDDFHVYIGEYIDSVQSFSL